MNPDITVTASAARREEGLTLTLLVTVPAGHYVYTPDADDGRPMQVQLPEGSPFELTSSTFPDADDGHATGTFTVTASLDGPPDADEVEVRFAYQVCEPMTCYMPTTRSISATVSS